MLFIGVGAVGGATAMFVDPSGKTVGMAEMLTYFKALPFADVLFSFGYRIRKNFTRNEGCFG